VSTDKQLVLDAIKSHPNWSVRKLARHLLITHPDQFTSINAARWMIRRINEYDIPGVAKVKESPVSHGVEIEDAYREMVHERELAEKMGLAFTSDKKVGIKKVKRKITHKVIELSISIRLRT
jgi:hypothetical protein